MSYVDEVIEQVIKQNPAEPEFHQAVREVLESLRVVVDANEAQFKEMPFLKDWLTLNVRLNSEFPG